MKDKNKELRTHLYDSLYMHPEVYRMNKKGQHIIHQLFTHFTQDMNLLPLSYSQKISDSYPLHRVVCDYIAGMTDVYALKEYNGLSLG